MATPFRPALPLLQLYAEYHRDQRNIATHLIGVPMIVFGVGVLLGRAQFQVGGLQLTLAWLALALSVAWYLTRGRLGLGVATAAGVGGLVWWAHSFVAGPTSHWLAWGLGTFVVGWIIQAVGHYYEGRKPAFVDDVVGLLVGPMFVVLEIGASAGLFKSISAAVQDHAGPTRLRDLAHPAAR